ncbi:MAG TPA: substrate-binding domain-containing protein [Ktedonobacteraceae bacterium]|jgi:ribose transport system substrate-binding protein|nr:substrate-binding domain-containing protein [Ktedonobacteraceae bacterium]
MFQSLRSFKGATIVMLLMLLLAACGTTSATGGATTTTTTTGTSSQSTSSNQVTSGNAAKIALVTINLQALFFVQMLDGAKQEAQKDHASLLVYNSNNDPSAESNAIDNYVQQKVDAIIVDAIDVNGIKPAIERAAKAHIYVVAVDSVVTDPAVSTQVGVDNCNAAQQLSTSFENWSSQKGLSHPKMGVVGALNSMIQNQRKDCFVNAVQTKGASVLQTVDGQNQNDVAQTAAQNLYTANPNMDVVYATGEPALIGSIAAARSQGKTNIPIFGWDLSKESITGIDDGFVIAVVQQDATGEGVQSVDAAIKLKAGQTVAKNINVPVTIVTKANVDKFRSQFN